jgi:hypothetical protein
MNLIASNFATTCAAQYHLKLGQAMCKDQRKLASRALEDESIEQEKERLGKERRLKRSNDT